MELNTENSKYNQIISHNKCPKCGATDISQSKVSGLLRCNYCRLEFEEEKILEDKDISSLKGIKKTAGVKDIADDASDIMTLQCAGCGAEVVINTANGTLAKCHWCRSYLSINKQVANGAVPDYILPFKLSKAKAQNLINNFVGNRRFFADKQFKNEFTSDNINGVYFPYMLVDINGHMYLKGEGEITTRVIHKEKQGTRYDADVYKVERDFDITVDSLTVEASLDKLDVNSQVKTTNIINSIMPFDTENCVKYDSNYLRGFTAEKRDVNIEKISRYVYRQAADIARIGINPSLKRYDRGVSWKKENFDVIGQSWRCAYLPVWLYSYLKVSGNNKTLHYVSVNARTEEVMGSVPINYGKLFIVSLIIEIFSFIIAIFGYSNTYGEDRNLFWLFLTLGFLFYWLIYSIYRNSKARHTYEKETKKEIINLRENDTYVKARHDLASSSIDGRNNHKLGDIKKSDPIFFKSIFKNEDSGTFINVIHKNEVK